ncbi:MarR family winged helix-turn-helix transcriptional regulator [Mycolicibacterium smegmatis]|uniref:MarR-family protein transcriptional regulator n=1 Tax=Mycolicibacterium smegmatis (strain ATCC 700084 / mc(2)155) TaxID=246196 RepID=A0R3S6_MYCS2|nr:MarR family transcriptional regulator [Mycolicibacterium smegmatis]ABK75923.1 MarR-family protein transcriptional regulator [Mycolicibacterium smegmatis MC2 155]AIU10598.1 MarR family transcriptional regulator [Mycolicibacterium smegmatis MC2 155]AIU17223.1 MarR family transcriptional regulator [Mycolicibacterium smegmatis]AIU23846.1 MarR family transcriptional regulator [Mycolicibacterium smegmatis]MCC3336848.1 MarR family transcriptional regulator [Mycolicibacterium smegmatis]
MTDSLPGLDKDENRTWAHFLESTTLILDELNRQLMSCHDMTLPDVQLLDLLAKSGNGSARVGDIADELTAPPSTATGQIARLEEAGLVRRGVSSKDRRGVTVTLTPAGCRRLKPALATYARFVRLNYLNPLTRRQMLAVGDNGRRISEGLRGPRRS